MRFGINHNSLFIHALASYCSERKVDVNANFLYL